MAPDYFWLGRGFGQMGSGDFSQQWDPTGITMHVNQGRFYNGIIGLLVNTGFAGTVFMVLFLGCGTALAWRILRHLRTHGCEDSSSGCAVFSADSGWRARFLLSFHGDSEHAMKSFSAGGNVVGLLLSSERRLKPPNNRPPLIRLESPSPRANLKMLGVSFQSFANCKMLPGAKVGLTPSGASIFH